MFGDMAPGKVDLLAQISELQEAVASMKGSLTEAVTRLGAAAAEEQQSTLSAGLKDKCDQNTAEVLKLVLALKTDLTSLKKEVSSISERQELLQRTVDVLLQDRRAHHHGNGEGVTAGGSRSAGALSNDSGVALLLEQAQQVFNNDRLSSSPATSALHRTSDQDSLPDQPSLLVPPLVYDYVAGLSPNGHTSANSANLLHGGLGGGDSEELGYDSDSSLTLAANKSISLSATISKELRAGIGSTQKVSSKSSKSKKYMTPSCSTDSGGPVNRTDSDGSDQSRDAVVQTSRRKRYEKSSSCSSTGKLYGPLSRSLSQDSSPYQAVSVFGGGGMYGAPEMTYGTRHAGGGVVHHYHHHRDNRDSLRCKVAKELLETEKKYCRTLWIIQDTFAEPLKKTGILAAKDINTLFPPEVYQLYDKHCHLQHQLRERLASWQWQPMVGDILAKFTDSHHSDVLRLYTSYVNDFPEVLKTFHKLCRSSPAFTKFIKSCLDQPSSGGLDLGAFLLTPVQRIPRYILLLKQLLKYTEESHPDHHHVNVCLDRLKEFLERLNDSIEHSFQLVHATFGGNGTTSHQTSNSRQGYSRTSRSPRRTRSIVETSPSYSPEGHVPSSRSAERPDSREGTGSGAASPKRSISITGGKTGKSSGLTVHHKKRPPSTDCGRSRSLPRAAPVSPVHSLDEPATVKGRPKKSLPSARSVADMTAPDTDEIDLDGEDGEGTRWPELAASEPSLLESSTANTRLLLTSNVGTAENHRLKENCAAGDVPTTANADDNPAAKKKSIKSSLKNMFTFKKSHHSHSGGRAPQPSDLRTTNTTTSCSNTITTTTAAAPPQHHHHHKTPPHHHHYHHPHDHHHYHHHKAHHSRSTGTVNRVRKDESDYWDPQTQALDAAIPGGVNNSTDPSPMETSTSIEGCTNNTTQTNSTSTATIYQPLSAVMPPHPPSTPVPGTPNSLTLVGDFVDEDGNPCSNV